MSFTSRFLLLGDFNFWVDSPSVHPYSSKFISLLESFGFSIPTPVPTHISGHTLDLAVFPVPVLSSDPIPPKVTVYPPDPVVSDHSLLITSLPISSPPVSSLVCYRSYKCYDQATFFSLLSSLFPLSLLNTMPPAEVSPILFDVLSRINDIIFPLISSTVRAPSDPWMNSHLRLLKRSQRNLERTWKRSGTSTDWSKFCSARSVYLSWLSEYKSLYFKSRLNSLSRSPKALWSTLNTLTGLRSPSVVSNLTASDLATYFSDKISSARASLASSNTRIVHSISNCSFSSFTHVTLSDVLDLLHSSKIIFSPSDPINFKAISDSLFLLAPFLLHIINSSFLHGEFYADKHATILPILKKPSLDPSMSKNYRPISLIGLPSKLLEVAIFAQLSPFLNNFFDPHLSGFRPSHSTESVLLSLTNDAFYHFSFRRSVLLVLLDMSSAFDLVDHSILVNDLSNAGLCSTALSLLHSYLSDRTYSVKFNSSHSNAFLLSSGVPQGSVLGPLLFNLYMSSLCLTLNKYSLSYHIYADDIQLCLPYPFPHNTFLSEVLDSITSWAVSRRLLINNAKSEFIFLHPPRLSPPLLPFPLSSSVRNLGVIFDSSLSFANNINAVVRTCRLILRSLYPLRSYIDQSSAIKLVQAFIFSRLDYCNSLYFHIPKYSLQSLQRVINQSCRFVFYPDFITHTSPFLYKLKWLPITSRIKYKLCCMIFKLIHNPGQPTYLAELFTAPVNRFSRKALPLRCPRATNESPWSAKSVFFYGPRIYNSLPSSITSSTSFNSFSSSLRRYLLDLSYDPATQCLSLFATI